MKNKKKKFPMTKKVVASLIVGALVSAITIILGHLFASPQSSMLLWKIPTLILCVAFLVILYKRYARRCVYAFLKRIDKEHLMKLKHREICLDERKLRREYKCSVFITAIYFNAIVISAFMILFFRSAFGIGISMIPAVYVLWSVPYICIHMLFPDEEKQEEDDEENNSKEQKEPRNLLTAKEYPLLYEIVQNLKKKMGIRKKIRLYVSNMTEGCICVYETLMDIAVFLDVENVALFTKKELEQILIHEFAHVTNGDTKDGWLFVVTSDMWWLCMKNGWGKLALYLFNFIVEWTNVRHYRYRECVSCSREILADKKVLEIGDAQEAANAHGKLAMYGVYMGNPYRDFNLDLSQIESLSNHPEQYRMKQFQEELEKKEEEWREIVELEIPKKLSSHPISRERIKACNVSSYNVRTKETDEAYRKEVQKLIEFREKLWEKDDISELESMKDDYENRMRLINKFNSEESPYEAFTYGELYEIANAFQATDDNKALEIVDYILKQMPEHISTLALKGTILLRQGKKDGLEYLFKAIERPSSDGECYHIDFVKDYAHLYGRKDVLERLEKNVKWNYDDRYEWENQCAKIREDDIVHKKDFSEKMLKRLQTLIKENPFARLCPSGIIKEVLFVQKKEGNKDMNLCYIVFSQKTHGNLMISSKLRDSLEKEMMNVIVRELREDDKTYKILKKKVPDCCIYHSESDDSKNK